MKLKTITRIALLLFVSISIIVFVRDECSPPADFYADQNVYKPANADGSSAGDANFISPQTKLVAYYFHGHRRCPSCLKMEATAREAISEGFPSEMKGQQLVWRTVDIQDAVNKHFASDYQVYWNSLVLVRFRDGRQLGYRDLDQIWQMQQDDNVLRSYIQTQVRAYLGAS